MEFVYTDSLNVPVRFKVNMSLKGRTLCRSTLGKETVFQHNFDAV